MALLTASLKIQEIAENDLALEEAIRHWPKAAGRRGGAAHGGAGAASLWGAVGDGVDAESLWQWRRRPGAAELLVQKWGPKGNCTAAFFSSPSASPPLASARRGRPGLQASACPFSEKSLALSAVVALTAIAG